MGTPNYEFILDTGFAVLPLLGLLLNWIFDPSRELLSQLVQSEYQ